MAVVRNAMSDSNASRALAITSMSVSRANSMTGSYDENLRGKSVAGLEISACAQRTRLRHGICDYSQRESVVGSERLTSTS